MTKSPLEKLELDSIKQSELICEMAFRQYLQQDETIKIQDKRAIFITTSVFVVLGIILSGQDSFIYNLSSECLILFVGITFCLTLYSLFCVWKVLKTMKLKALSTTQLNKNMQNNTGGYEDILANAISGLNKTIDNNDAILTDRAKYIDRATASSITTAISLMIFFVLSLLWQLY